MDNKTYLDQIAVKGKNSSAGSFAPKKSLISPAIIKLILVGLIIIATLLGVLNVIKQTNKADFTSHQTLYLRAQNLAAPSSPLYTYAPKVKSDDVREETETLLYIINKLNTTLANQIVAEGGDVTDIPESVLTTESQLASEYTQALADSLYTGTLDRTYVNKTYHQITMLSAAVSDVKNKATSEDFAKTLAETERDLAAVEEKFLEFTTIY